MADISSLFENLMPVSKAGNKTGSKVSNDACKNAASNNQLSMLLNLFADKPEVPRQRGAKQHLHAEIHNYFGSVSRLIAAMLSKKTQRNILYITAHLPQAEQACDDIETFLGRSVQLLPAFETSSDINDVTSEIACERLRLCRNLALNNQTNQLNQSGNGNGKRAAKSSGEGSKKSTKPATRTIKTANLKVAGNLTKDAKISDNRAVGYPVIVCAIPALMGPVVSADFLRSNCLNLTIGQELAGGTEYLAQWLSDNGFIRLEQVETIGDFACRGGIIDIFVPSYDNPVRIELFGDTVESIRFFDPDSQQSTKTVQTFTLTTSKAPDRSDSVSFLEYLPDDTIIVAENVLEISEFGRLFRERISPDSNIYSVEEVLSWLERYDTLQINRFASGTADVSLSLPASSTERFNNRGRDALRELYELAQGTSINSNINNNSNGNDNDNQKPKTHKVFLFCGSSAEQKRIQELLTTINTEKRSQSTLQNQVPKQNKLIIRNRPDHSSQQLHRLANTASLSTNTNNFYMLTGSIQQGFALENAADSLIITSSHEIFGKMRPYHRLRRTKTTPVIETFTDLEKGDLVVHNAHGIAIFHGLKIVKKNNRSQEYLELEYADGAVINVPVSQIHQVHKYIGCRGTAADAVRQSAKGRVSGSNRAVSSLRLSRLQSSQWEKQKQRVIAAVQDYAAELVRLQAMRSLAPGIAYPPDSNWQKEFEQSFAYQETPDQEIVNREIKHDMQLSRPMDRLLCGDVGYGKTELAIRAAFKAIEAGKQVAVLVPTTILAEQHYRTFCERLAEFPFVVEVLSRFKTPSQAADIIKRTAYGGVDILIGTHRILSADVHFKDLGLVVIDEEQRFGVRHKEHLKQIRATVDILTMTATPIPRTLHMALLGIRDISSLSSPPLDRRSIITEVCPYNENTVRKAILRELSRDGQVFFLHNRVHNIRHWADIISKIVPEARIGIAHGRMPRHELENRMLEFFNHKLDVLVCTTIIESGLDVPNANTIIINDADRFGLAQLHQLRGRVGRYKNRAYACLMLPVNRTMNPIAVRRLKAIEQYSHLGAGFNIALRDLEIRGAGNILGMEQSGHIDAVGYELYCQLLSNAIRQHKNIPQPLIIDTHIDLGIDCLIPSQYISSTRQRMAAYRQLAHCRSLQDIDQLKNNLRDISGKLPQTLINLLKQTYIRILASQWSIKSIIREQNDIIFTLNKPEMAPAIFQNIKNSSRVLRRPDKHTFYLKIPVTYTKSAHKLLDYLIKILKNDS